jgi:hypothetical protein
LASAKWLQTVDGHSGAELRLLVVEPNCLDTEGIDAETGTETGGEGDMCGA